MKHSGMIRRELNGKTFYYWEIFENYRDRIRAVLTTRAVGRDFSSAAGRACAAEALELKENAWELCRQVHGSRIADAAGCNKLIWHSNCDGVELGMSGVIAAVQLADCHPVIVYDPARHRGVVAHAGWRGTAAGIAEKAVWKLRRGGSRTEDLVAAAGPGIGPCCYNVGKEVKQTFMQHFPYSAKVFRKPLLLDIAQANKERLMHAGVSEKRIGTGYLCTSCHPDEFYSYRLKREKAGRQAALLALL